MPAFSVTTDRGQFKFLPIDKEATVTAVTVLQIFYTRPDYFFPHGLPLFDVVDIPFKSEYICMTKDLVTEKIPEIIGGPVQLDDGVNYAIVKLKS